MFLVELFVFYVVHSFSSPYFSADSIVVRVFASGGTIARSSGITSWTALSTSNFPS